jgi:hypothetical protein
VRRWQASSGGIRGIPFASSGWFELNGHVSFVLD